MKLHRNAALSWSGRRLLARRVVEQGWTLSAAAEAAGVSVRCARKWVGRYRLEGERGLRDRSSAPRRVANRTPADRVAAIVALRQLRMTAAEIAETLAMPLSTVSAVLKPQRGRSAGPDRPRAGDPLRAVASRRTRPHRRQEARSLPGRGQTSRLPTGGARQTAPPRRQRARPRHQRLGVRPHRGRRLQPPRLRRSPRQRTGRDRGRLSAPSARLLRPPRDHGRADPHRQRQRLHLDAHALACRALGLRHLRTRPRRPQTNGKAERFIRTMLNGWAYAAIYRSSTDRTKALDGWLWHYNHQRRHSALGHQPPISRTNLLGSYS